MNVFQAGTCKEFDKPGNNLTHLEFVTMWQLFCLRTNNKCAFRMSFLFELDWALFYMHKSKLGRLECTALVHPSMRSIPPQATLHFFRRRLPRLVVATLLSIYPGKKPSISESVDKASIDDTLTITCMNCIPNQDFSRMYNDELTRKLYENVLEGNRKIEKPGFLWKVGDAKQKLHIIKWREKAQFRLISQNMLSS